MADGDPIPFDPTGGLPEVPGAPGDGSETVINKATGNPFTPLNPAEADAERRRLNRAAGAAGALSGASQAGNAAQQATAPTFTNEQIPGASDFSRGNPFAFSPGEQNIVTPYQQDNARKTLEQIQADQIAYKNMPSYSGFAEGAVSLANQLAGGATSLENLTFPELKVGRAAWRALHPLMADMLSFGFGQAVVQGVADPWKQAAEIKAGLRKEFDPIQTSLAIPTGFAFGAGITAINRGASIMFKSGMDALGGRMTESIEQGLVPEVKPNLSPEPPKAPPGVFEPSSGNTPVPSADNAAAVVLRGEPPVAEGTTRLYRAEKGAADEQGHVAFTTQRSGNADSFIDVSENMAVANSVGDRVFLPQAVADQAQKLPPIKEIAPAEPAAPPNYDLFNIPKEDEGPTLSQFIRQRGGLKPNPELDAIYGRNKLDLVRKKGSSLDNAREAAVEAGYLDKEATINDLLDALAGEDRGIFRYENGQSRPKQSNTHIDQAEHDVRAVFNDLGEQTTGANRDVYRRSVELVYREGVEPELAVERAIMEHGHYAEAEGHGQRIPANEIPFDAQATPRASGEVRGNRDAGSATPGETARGAGGISSAAKTTGEDVVAQRMKGMAGVGHAAAPGTSHPGAGVAGSHAIEDLGGVQNLQDAIRSIGEKLGLSVRKGANKAGATGEYNFNTEIVRLNEQGGNAFVTFAHELGHHVNNVVKGIDALIKKNLNVMEAYIQKYASAGGLSPKETATEGFGEFMAAYLSNRKKAELVSPQFIKEFRTLMESNAPELLKALDDANATWLRYQNSSSRQAGMSIIKSNTEIPKNIPNDPLDRGPLALWFTNMYTNYVNRTHPMMTAIRYLAEQFEKKHGYKLDLPTDRDPAKLLQMFGRGGHQMSVMDMTYGVQSADTFSPNGPALFSIMQRSVADPITGAMSKDGATVIARQKAFDLYLVALWHRDLRTQMSNGESELTRPPTQLTDGQAERIIAETEAMRPDYVALAEELYAYNKELLRKELTAGLRTKESYDELMDAKNHRYVPLRRDMTDFTEAFRTSGGSGASPKNLENLGRIAREGSDRNILSPVESLMLRNFSINDQMTQNWMTLALRDLVRLVGGKEGARIAEEIPNTKLRALDIDMQAGIYKMARTNGWLPEDARALVQEIMAEVGPETRIQLYRTEAMKAGSRPIIFGWDQGERFALQLPDGDFGRQLQQVMDSVGPKGMNSWAQSSGLLFNILASTSSTLRAGATGTPTFMAKNTLRDAFMQYLTIPEASTIGTLSMSNAIRGGKSYLQSDDFYRMYLSTEGIRGGLTAASLDSSRTIGAMEREAFGGRQAHRLQAARVALAEELGNAGVPGHKQIFFSELKHAMSAMEISESAGRIGLFKTIYEQNIAMGRDQRYAMFDAAQKARDFIDYGRFGSKMEMMARLVPFLNANVQGIDKFFRTYVGTATNPGLLGRPSTQQQAEYQAALRQALIPRAVTVAAISAGITYAYMDDPVYQAIPVQMRSQYWIFRLPFLKSGIYGALDGSKVDMPEGMQGAWMVIPKPWEPGTIFNMAEKAVEFVNSGDPEQIKKFVNSMRYTFNIPNPLEMPLIRTGQGLASNYNTFFQMPIVPDSLKNVAPHLQSSEYTNKFYVALAQGLNMAWDSKDAHDWFKQNIPIVGAMLAAPWSPMEAQYLMQGLFGDWPRELGGIGGIGRSLATGERIKMDDVPAVRAFIKERMSMGEPMSELYNQIGQNSGRLSVAQNTFSKLIKDGDPTSAQVYFNGLDQSQRDYLRIHNADGGPIVNVLHPLDRTRELATVTRNIKNGLLTEAGLATLNNPSQHIKLEPGIRDSALQILNEYTATQARNALILQGAKGFTSQPIVPTDPYLKMIEQISPELRNELSARMAQKKVMPLDTIKEYWPSVQREVRVGGDPKDLSIRLKGIGLQAAIQGYEGGGMKLGRGAADSSGQRIKRGKAQVPTFAPEGAEP